MTGLTLSQLFVYPIKSTAGISVTTSVLTTRGLQFDRRYMVVSPDGQFMTQRRFPKMALIRPMLSAVETARLSEKDGCELNLTAAEMESLLVTPPTAECDVIEVEVWGDRIPALSCGPAAQAWFSKFLSTPCQLVYMPNSSQRPIDHGKLGAQEIVSFADAYPYLLLSEASLAGLNQKLAANNENPVPMNRFRPNLVVSGDMSPHAEDDWKRIRIGAAIFKVAKPCARCSVPNVDQASGQRNKEPSRTLATYRAWDKAIWFGQNLIQENADFVRLQVGDEVEILA